MRNAYKHNHRPFLERAVKDLLPPWVDEAGCIFGHLAMDVKGVL